MANIRFSHICKTYLTGTEAVRNFNLEVADGEFVVLIGPSGCGKSSVLRMTAGLEEITSGELEINGRIVNDLPPKARNVAMVFQNYALFPNMTVEANLGFALKMQRVPKAERRERVLEMAKILKIEELLPKKAKKLSGGQCQRIAIGRALVCRPQLFLLDEPLSNLDAAMRGELRSEIAALQKKWKVTTLYVTHDLTEAMTLGDRIVVLEEGEIRQVDSPQDLCLKPRNTFVARFTAGNSMNLFPADCVREKGRYVLKTGDASIPLPAWKSRILEERSGSDLRVTAGIRMEDLCPECEGSVMPDGEYAPVRAQVENVDVLGAEKKLYLRVGDVTLTALVRTYAAVGPGDEVTLRVMTDRIHLFDGESGEAIVH